MAIFHQLHHNSDTTSNRLGVIPVIIPTIPPTIGPRVPTIKTNEMSPDTSDNSQPRSHSDRPKLFRVQLRQNSSYTPHESSNGPWRNRSARRGFGRLLGDLRTAKGGKSGMKWVKLILVGCMTIGFAVKFSDQENIGNGIWLAAGIAALALLVRDAANSK
jgi:hypothetical protein